MLEEAILDDLGEGLDLLEVPLSKRAFNLVKIAVLLVITLVFGRVIFLGGIKADFYKNRALINAGLLVSIPTERGIIFDRFNKPLVKNLSVYRLSLKLPELLKEEGKHSQTLEALNKILGISIEEIEALIKNVDLEKQNSIILNIQLNEEQANNIKNLNLSAVQIEENFKREYFDSYIFSHILGYTGPVNKTDLKENDSFSLNDTIGKTGLENYYDDKIRGQEGQIIYYRNVKGEIIDDKFLRDSQKGNNIITTIDSELQKYFYERLKLALNNLGSSAGAGLALDPKTGEILALVSLPSFDSNKITAEALNNPNQPFFNRVISGVYSPGSTIKPLVAYAALKEKIIDTQDKIFSGGYIEIPNPYFPDNPSRFVDWKAHGWVDFHSALARSSNVYFYTIGGGFENVKGLGIYRLKKYWQEFGLSDKTGVDLSGESSGFLPDPEEREKRTGQPWRVGDTYNVSIGQGDFIITPIELLSYITAVANNGKIYKPHAVKAIISDNGESINDIKLEVINDLSEAESADYFKEVERGMIDAVEKSYGTAYLLNNLPLKVAAKTGTAQIQGNTKINAFFVGYTLNSPNNQEIAILVLVENAKEGALNAVPVANDVLRWYYENRIKSK